MSKIEEAMEGYWGARCPDHHAECPACKAWGEYDTITVCATTTASMLLDEMNDWDTLTTKKTTKKRMCEMKTSELQGVALDWAVAKCEGVETRNNKVVYFVPPEAESDDELEFVCSADDDAHAIEQCENAYPNCTVDRVDWTTRYDPSTDWAQGGPIIEREKIGIDCDDQGVWFASYNLSAETAWGSTGLTPLIAAMRCYVASKLGDEVDVPEELE